MAVRAVPNISRHFFAIASRRKRPRLTLRLTDARTVVSLKDRLLIPIFTAASYAGFRCNRSILDVTAHSWLRALMTLRLLYFSFVIDDRATPLRALQQLALLMLPRLCY